MPLSFRILRRSGAFLLCCVVLNGSFIGGQEPIKEPGVQQPLPLTRVVLFSSSVGFFEHSGELEGNQQIEFSFKASDINDLLKSMVVQDKDGGLITAVNYGSPDPLEKTLQTFTIDLTESPTLAEIFQQLRGQEVHLETSTDVKGIVVGVERRNLPLGGKEFAEVDVVNLRTEQGLRSVRIDTILRTQLANPKIDKEFQQALALLAGASSTDKKQVKLDFQGKGKRKVSVGYIQEAPVWKTSYRLVLDDEKKPMLQGWAIVENTTAQDWQNVQLTLVSGRPISFQMDLYQPLFMARPFVTPSQHAMLLPRTYNQDLDADGSEGFEKGGGHFGGAMGGMGGGMGGMMGTPEGISGMAPPRRPGVDLKRGVKVAADASEVGELFRYSIQEPVKLPRNESAMLPIVNHEIQAEKVAIYNASVHVKHPLSGLKLTNSTDLHWLQGPITLFDGGEYAGDAQIEDVPPKASRLISYALDLEIEVVTKKEESQRAITALTVRKGGAHFKYRVSQVQTYTLKNSSDKARKVLVEYPISGNWTVAKPKPDETTRDVNRFAVEVPAGKTTTLTIEDEHPQEETFVLADLEIAKLEGMAQVKNASPKVKQFFKDLIAAKTNVSNLDAERVKATNRRSSLLSDQQHVRTSLGALPKDKDGEILDEVAKQKRDELLKRYLGKMSTLENQLDEVMEREVALLKQGSAAEEALVKVMEEGVAE